MSAPLLELDSVYAGYGQISVLKGLSMTVNRGEIVAIIGANGAGKSTTLMCVSGIHKANSGSIKFNGQSIVAMPAHEIVRSGMAQIPEGRKIFPRMSVLENLQLGAFIRGRADLTQDIERVFTLFPALRDRRNQLGGTLSGGEQQMLAIGRALMSRPTLLLMDEPSMGVAPILVRTIFATIQELNKQGMTILLVEQNACMALKIAHRGYVMETGKFVLQDEAAKLLKDERVRKAYLGDA
jgi:branched-chain amino acid transport system ATP-binding protein